MRGLRNEMGVSPAKVRAVFLDRDGVINKVVFRDNRPASPRSLDEFVFNNGIRQATRKLKDYGFKLIVVRNQPDLVRGEIKKGILDLMTQKIRWESPIDDVLICPHDDIHQCFCRKPKPGMLLEAASRWRIDLPSSFLIGDTWKDIGAAEAAGCKAILLDAPYNQGVRCDFRVESLSEAVNLIIKT